MVQDIRQKALRELPQIEELLRTSPLEQLCDALPRAMAVQAARDAVDEARQEMLSLLEHGKNGACPVQVDSEAIALRAARLALAAARPSLRRVVNAAGVVIHTNLGRSVMAPSAVEAARRVAEGYSTLEYDTERMARGSRNDHCERLLCLLTGAQAALAVNNNAAAVMLVLSEFSKRRQTIVSRGQLVEIGGSFRIPDIMELSGAHMVEVGTTNKTHVNDFKQALTDQTALLLKVHPSNYRMTGFTESVSVKELKALADKENRYRAERELADSAKQDQRPWKHAASRDVLVYEDQGSGSLLHLSCFNDYAEPTVHESLREGCDLVSFSGDKILGGPQAGIIVGRKDLIDRLKANPLSRALRLDKMTLAALEETLRLYLSPERALREIPTLAMLTATVNDLRPKAEQLLAALQAVVPSKICSVDIVEEVSRAGGGALPMCDIPTLAVRISFIVGNALDCERALIQQRQTPIIGRIKKDSLLFDVRTLAQPDEIDLIAKAVAEYFEKAA